MKRGYDEPGGHGGAGGKGSSPGAWIQNFGTWSEETRGIHLELTYPANITSQDTIIFEAI